MSFSGGSNAALLAPPVVLLHGNSRLHMAAEKGAREESLALIRDGADINARNDVRCGHERPDALQDGQTPLHRAAANGHMELTRMLLTNGASVNAANKVLFYPASRSTSMLGAHACAFLPP